MKAIYNTLQYSKKARDYKRNDLLLKISYAINFTPHKIEYYKNMLKKYDIENNY